MSPAPLDGRRAVAPSRVHHSTPRAAEHVYAALDLGTNNCRLLIARPERRQRRRATEALRIVDAFSRIVRLGEGLGRNGRISEAAIERTLEALQICRDKMESRGVTRARLVATQACRTAANGDEFTARARERTGLELEIIDRETEARFAARGCGNLADTRSESVLLFDIGGGSTELVWLARPDATPAGRLELDRWTSVELGVVSLAEHFGGKSVSAETFEAMTNCARDALRPFAESLAGRVGLADRKQDLFVLGMFSLLDAVLDRPKTSILEELPLGADVREALLGGSNRLRHVLDYVVTYEQADWEALPHHARALGLDEGGTPSLYLVAVQWSQATFGLVHSER